MKVLRLWVYIALWSGSFAGAHAQHIGLIQQGHSSSLRGLSVVDDHVAWVSGSKGTLARTIDGGRTWHWQQVKGFEQADFRDVEAFSATEAIIISSGTPALILKTTDGGASWKIRYRNDDRAYFLDAMDFMPDGKHGFVLGDPIAGKFLLLETLDGGLTWAKSKNPPDALPGEAAFAASGTCLRVTNKAIRIVTGGKISRYLAKDVSVTGWTAQVLPVQQGKDSQGAFSLSGDAQVFVGGDYSDNQSTDSTVCHSLSLMQSLTNRFESSHSPIGYQSCVEHIKLFYLSTGTPGSGISTDGGRTWKWIDGTSFNVCRKAKHGSLVLLAGDQGKIGLFTN